MMFPNFFSIFKLDNLSETDVVYDLNTNLCYELSQVYLPYFSLHKSDIS